MSLSGRVTQLTIKDENNPEKIRKLADTELRSTSDGGNSKVTITIPLDDEIILEFYLRDCTYINVSSSPGSVECIRIEPIQQTLVIIDKKKECTELLAFIRDYLTKGQSDDEKVIDFITALNSSDDTNAAENARELARKKLPIRFLLDKIDNSTTDQQSSSAAELFKLPVIIESILDRHDTQKPYEVVIRRDTTIRELKTIVESEAGIDCDHQHWYFNREPLRDSYKFDAKTVELNKDRKLFLYIANH